MNIFDVIGGNQKLKEPHVSSVLAWLLDPHQTHGCDTIFLRRLLNMLDPEGHEFDKYLGSDGEMVAKGQAAKASIEVFLEYPVTTKQGDLRYIDIVMMFSDESNKHAVIVENKILSSSAKADQLVEQVEGLKILHENDEPTTISCIYLTPEKNKATIEAFENLDACNDVHLKAHVEWNNTTGNSVRDILIACLEDEAKGLMNPMAYETRFIVKSFVQFISNGFSLPSAYVQEGGKYSEGSIQGLEKLYQAKPAYIGFTGGKKALQLCELEKLISRVFKYNSSLEGKKLIKSNWIKVDDFFEIVESKGWMYNASTPDE